MVLRGRLQLLSAPRLAALVFGALLLCACAARQGGGQVLSRLYFGLSGPEGPIAEADFEAFLDTCVTPRFPDGLTKFHADGQWRGGNGKLVKEKSVVVEILRAPGADADRKLKEIVASYKLRFAQEAVLLIEDFPRVMPP